MMIVIRLLFVAQPAQGLDHIVLRITLARIDHVIDGAYTAEMLRSGITTLGGNPDLVSIGIAIKPAIAKIPPQPPKFPEVIRNVLTNIGDRAVRADNHLGIFIRSAIFTLGRLRARTLHHPASLIFAFGLEVEHALLFHLLEGQVPEVQMENLALLRKKVVLNIEPLHGFKMPPDDCGRDDLAHLGSLVASLLDVMQRLQAQLNVLLVLFVPLRDTGIEVPAVIIEGPSAGWIGDQSLYFALPFLLEIKKAHHHIRHLDAGVVDIVLYIDVCAGGAQQTDKGIAQNRIPQVPDVCGLVGIDAGVLDQNLLGRVGFHPWVGLQQQTSGLLPVHSGIDVTRARDFKLFKTRYGSESGDDFFGNFARRFAQSLCQFKAQRQRILAQAHVRRLVHHNSRQFKVILLFEKIAYPLDKLLL